MGHTNACTGMVTHAKIGAPVSGIVTVSSFPTTHLLHCVDMDVIMEQPSIVGLLIHE